MKVIGSEQEARAIIAGFEAAGLGVKVVDASKLAELGFHVPAEVLARGGQAALVSLGSQGHERADQRRSTDRRRKAN